MAKSKRMVGFEECTCSRCGAKAHTLKGKPHRWCQGSNKAERKAPKARGIWG